MSIYMSGGHVLKIGSGVASTSSFPLLQVSGNSRYFTAGGSPTLLMGSGDAQGLFQRSPTDVSYWLANRAGYGFNALWAMFCTNLQAHVTSQADGSTYNGTEPFLGTLDGSTVDGGPNWDLAQPNPVYFAYIRQGIVLAQSYGFYCFMDMWDNIAYGNVWVNNYNVSPSKLSGFGTYLANTFKDLPCIIWMVGNDFFNYPNDPDKSAALGLYAGVASSDSSHLYADELNPFISGGLDSVPFSTYLNMGSAYTYYPVYYQVNQEYISSVKTVPSFLIETTYEDATYGTGTIPTMHALRNTYYWTPLSGGIGGYFYGSAWVTWLTNWQTDFNSPGVTYLQIWKSFFNSIAWQTLVPDTANLVVTAGYGTATGNGTGSLETDTYVTTAADAIGSIGVSYCPVNTTLTVNMTKFRGTVTARWFDPTNNTYASIGSFANTGTHNFTSGNNANGDSDIVLRLDA